jgi:hypothetical protein
VTKSGAAFVLLAAPAGRTVSDLRRVAVLDCGMTGFEMALSRFMQAALLTA